MMLADPSALRGLGSVNQGGTRPRGFGTRVDRLGRGNSSSGFLKCEVQIKGKEEHILCPKPQEKKDADSG